MIGKTLTFALGLSAAMLSMALFHLAYLYVREMPLSLQMLGFCYLVNWIMAVVIFALLLRLAREKSPYLGFIFLAGSAFKFLVYFIIFDPLFKQDGSLSGHEFFLFFIPYLTALAAETFALIRLLRTTY